MIGRGTMCCRNADDRNTHGKPAAVEPRRRGVFRSLALVGPGVVVAGSVMGSGELINTPVQAARFGFVLLWAVILSCVIKFFLQVEIARHALVHNRTTFQALNHCPGPKWRGTHWIGPVWLAFHTDRRVRMGRASATALIVSASIILGCVLIGLAV